MRFRRPRPRSTNRYPRTQTPCGPLKSLSSNFTEGSSDASAQISLAILVQKLGVPVQIFVVSLLKGFREVTFQLSLPQISLFPDVIEGEFGEIWSLLDSLTAEKSTVKPCSCVEIVNKFSLMFIHSIGARTRQDGELQKEISQLIGGSTF